MGLVSTISYHGFWKRGETIERVFMFFITILTAKTVSETLKANDGKFPGLKILKKFSLFPVDIKI